MRLFIALICVLALAGCTNGAPPAVLPTAAMGTPQLPATLSLPALMAEPEQWVGRQMTLIAPIASAADNRVLVPAFTINGTPIGVDDGKRSLWLAEPLPEQTVAKLGDGVNVLKLRGQLSPPGAYGSDGRFSYQFTATSATLNPAERTTVASLAENPGAFDGVLLRVDCFILAKSGDILLVDELSEGGVPSTRARQIKLQNVPDQQLFSELQQSGEVRYGAVTITGWWGNSAMTPFEVSPSP